MPITIGQLRAILDRSGLSNDAPIFTAIVDDTSRDGNQDVGLRQTESDPELGLTMYFEIEYTGPNSEN